MFNHCSNPPTALSISLRAKVKILVMGLKVLQNYFLSLVSLVLFYFSLSNNTCLFCYPHAKYSLTLDYWPWVIVCLYCSFPRYPHCWGVQQFIFFIFLGSKITADGDCSHEIKKHLLLGRKAKTNLDSIVKGRDITLLTKVHIVKSMVFPVVMYGCESWTIKKAEHQRIDAFELWCWRRLLRVPWIARRSN